MTRRRIVAERLAALLVQLVVLAAVVATVTLALVSAIDFGDATSGGVVAATLGLLLLAAAFGGVAVAVGAATGRRAVALGAAAGVAVVSYVADALGGIVPGADWLSEVSPFSWYLAGEPLRNGVDAGGSLLLVGLLGAAAVVAMVTIERRDVGT